MRRDSVLDSLRALHVVAGAWMLVLIGVILVDVLGRWLFNSPMVSTPEIVANSIVAIAFLQLPFAIRTSGMLRTTIIVDRVARSARRFLNVLAQALGVAFFAGIAWSSWTPMLSSWSSLEYEGVGQFPVPVYPVRTILFAMSVLSAVIYTWMLVAEFFGSEASNETTPGI